MQEKIGIIIGKIGGNKSIYKSILKNNGIYISCFQIGSFITQNNSKENDYLGVDISYMYVWACWKMRELLLFILSSDI